MADDLDRTARIALKLAPQEALAWMVHDLDADLAFDGWGPTETIAFPGETARRCDTVAVLASRGGTQEPWLLVIEVEDAPPALMQEKVLEYKIRLRRELRHGPHHRDLYPVAGVVIFLSGQRGDLVLEMTLPGTDLTLQSKVRAVCPSRLEAGTFLERIAQQQLGRSLLIWAPLTNGAEKPEIAREVLRLAMVETDLLRRAAYIDLALVFAEWRGFGDVWRREMEGFNVWQSQFLETQRNLARLAQQRKHLLRVLQVRFPDNWELLRAQVEQATRSELLERCFEAALTGASVEEVRDLLASAEQRNGAGSHG